MSTTSSLIHAIQSSHSLAISSGFSSGFFLETLFFETPLFSAFIFENATRKHTMRLKLFPCFPGLLAVFVSLGPSNLYISSSQIELADFPDSHGFSKLVRDFLVKKELKNDFLSQFRRPTPDFLFKRDIADDVVSPSFDVVKRGTTRTRMNRYFKNSFFRPRRPLFPGFRGKSKFSRTYKQKRNEEPIIGIGLEKRHFGQHFRPRITARNPVDLKNFVEKNMWTKRSAHDLKPILTKSESEPSGWNMFFDDVLNDISTDTKSVFAKFSDEKRGADKQKSDVKRPADKRSVDRLLAQYRKDKNRREANQPSQTESSYLLKFLRRFAKKSVDSESVRESHYKPRIQIESLKHENPSLTNQFEQMQSETQPSEIVPKYVPFLKNKHNLDHDLSLYTYMNWGRF